MSMTIQKLNETRYKVTFNGTEIIWTTVTSSGQDVNEWLGDIHRFHQRRHSNIVIGFDVQSRPNTSSAQKPIAILQLCVHHRCLVFLLLHTNFMFTRDLREFLADNRFTFVGVGIDEKVERLTNDHRFTVARTIDLQGLAAEKMNKPELSQKGLARLAKEVLGVEVNKPTWVTMSLWDRKDLTHAQVMYATMDAFLSSKIGMRLLSGDVRDGSG